MFVRKKTLRGSQQATNTLLANYFGLPSNPPVLSFNDPTARKAQLNHLGTNESKHRRYIRQTCDNPQTLPIYPPAQFSLAFNKPQNNKTRAVHAK
ncbi:hypothetical protein N9B43_02940 [Mariniblastus sp.]|nr:hypothetical protein [Mariniblastus sp.]